MTRSCHDAVSENRLTPVAGATWRSWGTGPYPFGTRVTAKLDERTSYGGSDFAGAPRLPRSRTQRRFPAPVVLSAVAVAVAGGGESRLPRARRRGGRVRH